jgi:hypothetical protein
MVTVGGANLSVMAGSSSTCRNITKVAGGVPLYVRCLAKDRPIPESVVEIDRDGATVRERVGAAASTQAKYDGDSGYLVARAIFIDRVLIAFHSITSSARASKEGVTGPALFVLITNSNLVGCSTGRSGLEARPAAFWL